MFWFVLWVLARLFCFACDMGFGEVDFRGRVEKWGKSVGGDIGCEVWGMPMLAPKPPNRKELRRAEPATAARRFAAARERRLEFDQVAPPGRSI